MPKLHIATRGATNWRERLGDPEAHWKRRASAMETAVSWETAARNASGLPEPIERLFKGSELGVPELLLAVAEHKVRLKGSGGDSQCDVWALVQTPAGQVSLAVEAKALEPFGKRNETLGTWMSAGKSAENRRVRWEHLQANLPQVAPVAYQHVPYQILQRCAAAVIEARRFGLKHAAFVVQSFDAPDESFVAFQKFCQAVGVPAARGGMNHVDFDGLRLWAGWADCPFASDAEIATVL